MTKKEKKSIKKQRKKNGDSVQELLGIKTFTANGLKTGRDTLIFYSASPVNVSVLSHETVEKKIEELKLLLSACPSLSILSTDAAELFESNKAYLYDRIEKETNEKVRELLQKDLEFIDTVNSETSTGRSFCFVLKVPGHDEEKISNISKSVEQIIIEHKFDVKIMSKSEIKRFLAFWFGAGIYGDEIPDCDGQQYLEVKKNG